MLRRLYCIYDLLAEAPLNSLFVALGTDDEAKRMFREGVMDSQTPVGKNPADFGLCFVGTIDYNSLLLEAPALPIRPIMLGTDVVRELERARANAEQIQGGSGSASK